MYNFIKSWHIVSCCHTNASELSIDSGKTICYGMMNPMGFNDRRRVPMIKAALCLCIAAAYVLAMFGMSIILGAFIRYYENA